MHSTDESIGRKESKAPEMVKLGLTRRPSTASCKRAKFEHDTTRKVLAFNPSSRLALRRLQVFLATSERLSERLERTATPRGGGECAWKSVGYRVRGSQIPRSLSKATTATTATTTMECPWRGSSG